MLGLIKTLHYLYYDIEEDREENRRQVMSKIEEPVTAIAVDDCPAKEIIDNSNRIITGKNKANAYITFWLSG